MLIPFIIVKRTSRMFPYESLLSAVAGKLSTFAYSHFPSSCPICQLPQSGSLFCKFCKVTLHHPEFCCHQCAEPLPEDLTVLLNNSQTEPHYKHSQIRCGRCQKSSPAFDQVLAQLSYKPPLSKLIQDYKFSHNLFLIPCLVECLRQQLRDHLKQGYQLPDAIIAVPLHRKRIKQRGFNQSYLLARIIAMEFKLPLLSGYVVRTKLTGEQTSLNRKQRHSNINKAFITKRPFKVNGKKINKIAIIDDVITSGSTCHELARTLKKSGVTIVDVWCLAKTAFMK